jgi:hypothetical protein
MPRRNPNTKWLRPLPPPGPAQCAWRVAQWAADTGLSRAKVYQLLAAGLLQSKKDGKARLITTRPADYVASLPSGEAAPQPVEPADRVRGSRPRRSRDDDRPDPPPIAAA